MKSQPPLGISPRAGKVVVGLLLCFFMAWDLRAVATDQSPLPTDSVMEPASLLFSALFPGAGAEVEVARLKTWLANEKKGPLSAVITLLGGSAIGDPLVGARLPGVLVHGGSLALVGAMAARLGGGWSAGVLAVLLAGVTPGSFAWHRMDVHDALLSAPLLGILWFLVWPPRRKRGALALGLLVGLAAMLKVGVVLFLIGPGMVYIMERASKRGERGRLLITAVGATLVLLPWVVLAASTLAAYMGLSSHDKHSLPMAFRLKHYLLLAPLGWLYLSGALVSWVALRFASGVSRRFLLMVGLMAGGGVTLLVLAFDPMVRYMTPLYPLLALLMALALHRGFMALAAVWRRPSLVLGMAALLCVALLGLYVQANLVVHPEKVVHRMLSDGIRFPDQRPNNGLMKLLSRMKARGYTTLNLKSHVLPGDCPVSTQYIWARRGFRIPWTEPDAEREWLARGGVAHLLVCHDANVDALRLDKKLAPPPDNELAARLRVALLKTPYEVEASAKDPSGHVLLLLRFGQKARGTGPKPAPGPEPNADPHAREMKEGAEQKPDPHAK